MSSRRLILLFVIAGAVMGPLGGTSAHADGGRLQIVERQGDVQMSVFTAPNPLRAGLVDISVLLQSATTGEPLDEVPVMARLTPIGRNGAAIAAELTRANATNRLMQSALIEVPDAGTWRIELEAAVPGNPVHLAFHVAVGEPLAPWLSEWPWFSWPLLAVALFGVHRYRASSRVGQGRGSVHRPMVGSR